MKHKFLVPIVVLTVLATGVIAVSFFSYWRYMVQTDVVYRAYAGDYIAE